MLQARQSRQLRRADPSTSLEITEITGEAARLEAFDGHECIWLGRDRERGLTAIVAIHNTVLGPALGGTRIWPHESFEAGLTDALRLSRGMTLKSAVAGLPLGGGKAVIIADPRRDKTPALLEAYAEMLAALEGQFITAEDVGLTLADADFLRERTSNVCGTTRGGSGNPSPVTAHGVFLGLKAAVRYKLGRGVLEGLTVAVQGLGSVGWSLCDKLAGEGADLVVTDLDEARTREAAVRFHAQAVAPDEILTVRADIFAPCALGGILSGETIPPLAVKIVAGAANNQLQRHEDAWLLRERGILYAPDYVINAGGLINVMGELEPGGYNRDKVMRRVARIPEVLTEIFRRADAENRATNDVAQSIAEERIAEARKSTKESKR
jgi:leucine dehydrogenase